MKEKAEQLLRKVFEGKSKRKFENDHDFICRSYDERIEVILAAFKEVAKDAFKTGNGGWSISFKKRFNNY